MVLIGSFSQARILQYVLEVSRFLSLVLESCLSFRIFSRNKNRIAVIEIYKLTIEKISWQCLFQIRQRNFVLFLLSFLCISFFIIIKWQCHFFSQTFPQEGEIPMTQKCHNPISRLNKHLFFIVYRTCMVGWRGFKGILTGDFWLHVAVYSCTLI